MLGILIYETADVLFHFGKIGYNCISYGLGLLYNKNEPDKKIELENATKSYEARIEKLEKRLEQLEQERKQKT